MVTEICLKKYLSKIIMKTEEVRKQVVGEMIL